LYKKTIADLAYDILEKNHRPMHYRKITDELEKIKEIKAEKPHHDVNASMGVDQRFIRYQRGIWGLVKWKFKEAHLTYTLTSYCLYTGTIFLTSYLRPYFSWSRDDTNIPITFIDTEGEEIAAFVNYRKKFIIGLREWYQKKKLDVNDRLLIGLIDDNKKKYFIIAEKDILSENEKDISDTIYHILKVEKKPLTYTQIYGAIISQEPDKRGLFSDFINNILRNDLRYIEISKGHWGLTEWLNITQKLSQNLLYANTDEDIHNLLKEAFEFLGYKVEYLKINQQDMLIVYAELDYKSYSLIVTGLPKDYNFDIVNKIDWPAINIERKKVNAHSVILFSERFQVRELTDRADEENVQLYEFAVLNSIIKEHKKIPFSLFDLQIAFSTLHTAENNYAQLMEIRDRQWFYWNLIKDVVKILCTSKKHNTYMNFELLFKEIGKLQKYDNIDDNKMLIKKIINQLSQEPINVVEISETNNIIMSYQNSIIKEKINSLFHFFIDKETDK